MVSPIITSLLITLISSLPLQAAAKGELFTEVKNLADAEFVSGGKGFAEYPEPTSSPHDSDQKDVEPTSASEPGDVAPPLEIPPEMRDHFLQKLCAGATDSPNNKENPGTFRIDIGSPPFMHTSPDSDSTPKSEKEKFIARMNAARALTPTPSWTESYTRICHSTATLAFEIYPFNPSSPHSGWAWAAERLDACQHGPWPGGFSAEEREWRILRANLSDLPGAVREFYAREPENGEFCVVDGVAFFPPGVVLAWMPLFVGGEQDCGGKFGGLERYGRDVDGERVAGRVVGKVEVGNSVEVVLEVELMKRKLEGKDEL